MKHKKHLRKQNSDHAGIDSMVGAGDAARSGNDNDEENNNTSVKSGMGAEPRVLEKDHAGNKTDSSATSSLDKLGRGQEGTVCHFLSPQRKHLVKYR